MATFAGVRVSDSDALRLRGIGPATPWRPTQFRTEAPDEMVDALLWAIAELAGEHDETRDEHFEELHPRGPGGKFRTIAERVLHALKQHHASGGKGPDPLKDFNREQLRKVAKARGIDLPRGASVEHIKAALLEHVAGTAGGHGKPDVTPGKPATFDDRFGRAAAGKDALAAVGTHLPRDSDEVTTDKALSGAERVAQGRALRRYQSGSAAEGGFADINGYLRGKNAGSPQVKAEVAAIDNAMSPAGDDLAVWRTARTGSGIFGPDLSGDLTGHEWVDPGYMSTSISQGFARRFGGNSATRPGVAMRILAPRGTGAVSMDGEGEILLQRGLRLRVVADHGIEHEPGTAGMRRLDVEVVPGKPDVPAKKAVEKAAPDLTGHPHLSTDPAVREVQVENRIREAYRNIVARQGNKVGTGQEFNPGGLSNFVGLADIRDEIGEGVNRRELDDVLRNMAQRDNAAMHTGGQHTGFRLIPIANSKALRQRDRDAALVMGGEKLQSVSFADPSPRPLPGGVKPAAPDMHSGGKATAGRVGDALDAAWAPQRGPEALMASLQGLTTEDYAGLADHDKRRVIRSLQRVADGTDNAATRDQAQQMRDAFAAIGVPSMTKAPEPGTSVTLTHTRYSPAPVTFVREHLTFEKGGMQVQWVVKGEAGEIYANPDDIRLPATTGPAQTKADPLATFRAMTASDARDALDLKTIAELKPLLKSAGLPVSGRKRELVDRLVEHLHKP